MSAVRSTWWMVLVIMVGASACSEDAPVKKCGAADQCGEHGSCDDTSGEPVCVCDQGWDGELCDVCADGYLDYGDGECLPEDPCADDTDCAGQIRECLNQDGVAVCGDCLAGYHQDGGQCVQDDSCGPNTCSGHGDCDDSSGTVVCTCLSGYAGSNCQDCDTGFSHWPPGSSDCVDDPCHPDPCTGDHMVPGGCTQTGQAQYDCDCEAGYHWEEATCQPDCLDADGDGYGEGIGCTDWDCDDDNGQAYPGAPESCDGVDTDCDGEEDEDFDDLGLACDGTDDDWCENGTWTCTSDGSGVECVNETVEDIAESCDGQDNDCDGGTDEDFPRLGSACDGADSDWCENGTFTCTSDGSGVECVNETIQDIVEICDGLDNDCDGAVDDGDPGGGAGCDTGMFGICASGTQHCEGGAIVCVQDELPVKEVCANGLDEDCDGEVDESEDVDGDGWGHCDGDCCDDNCPFSSTPELVNPGAAEYLGNGIDDDCDPATSDTVPPADCSTAVKWTGVTGDDLAQAMDLCQFTTPNPPLAQKKWGVISAPQLFADGSTPDAAQLANMQDWASAVVADFGTVVFPQSGPTMAGLSTGRMRDSGDPGYIPPLPGTFFAVTNPPPPAFIAAHAGALPQTTGCSGLCHSTTTANDSVNLCLSIRVPTNAVGFNFQFRFYTADYPDYVCSSYNDWFLALLTSGEPSIPADTNIAFDPYGNYVTVNSPQGAIESCIPTQCYQCWNGTVELAGTGFEGGVGAGSAWWSASAPVEPGEDITLELMIFDGGDATYDSSILLDDFEWILNPAAP